MAVDDRGSTAKKIMAAGFGASGQNCMPIGPYSSKLPLRTRFSPTGAKKGFWRWRNPYRWAVLGPMIRWLRANGRSVRERLQLADLGYMSEEEPEVPIPLYSAFDLFRKSAVLEGPDFPARIITENSIADLGEFGRVILGSRTPRDALQRVVAALPRYSTHEQVSLRPIRGGLCVQAGWLLVLDDETMHLTQQFTASLVQGLCASTERGRVQPRSIRIRAHPTFGVEHLRPFFGAPLGMSNEATLAVDLDDDVLDATLLVGGSGVETATAEEWELLNGGSSFNHSARLVLRPMIDEPSRCFARLAKASGMSARSLQRTLTSEGTSFRRLFDELRRDRALQVLLSSPPDISAAAHRGRLCRSIFPEPRRAALDWSAAKDRASRDSRAWKNRPEMNIGDRPTSVLSRCYPHGGRDLRRDAFLNSQ
jgi:AraC-like DNA-binding protein